MEKGTHMQMDAMYKDLIMTLLCYLAMGTIGFSTARRFKLPSPWWRWAWLVAGAILAPSLIVVKLISVFGWNIYFNWLLEGYVLGMLVGLSVRELRTRRQPA